MEQVTGENYNEELHNLYVHQTFTKTITTKTVTGRQYGRNERGKKFILHYRRKTRRKETTARPKSRQENNIVT
jgi:hypothetical protein